MAQQSNAPQTRPPPLSVQLALLTVQIEIYSGDTCSATGTGFFFYNEDTTRLFLVTNRHIVRDEEISFYPDYLVLKLHTNPADLRQSSDHRVELYHDDRKQKPVWKEIDPTVDVVAVELAKPEMQRRYIFLGLAPKDFMPKDKILTLGDPVVIIGYPRGFSDETFNLPVARQGAVASVFTIPFRGNRFFLVDANLHSGTSGSPVITTPSTISVTEKGVVHHGRLTFCLVGVNSGSYEDLELNAVWFTDVISELIK